MKKGIFITIEGPEGSGKTTINALIVEELKKRGYDVIVTREPGGIEIAEQIRDVILNTKNTKMDPRTEALLYAASRRQHLVEKVIPALRDGKIVMCDRFVHSSLAYQGVARGLGVDEVMKINEFAIEGHMPDATLYFDLDPKIGLERIAKNKNREVNRLDMEETSFHEKVRNAYLMLLERDPNMHKINAEKTIEEVFKETMNLIENILN